MGIILLISNTIQVIAIGILMMWQLRWVSKIDDRLKLEKKDRIYCVMYYLAGALLIYKYMYTYIRWEAHALSLVILAYLIVMSYTDRKTMQVYNGISAICLMLSLAVLIIESIYGIINLENFARSLVILVIILVILKVTGAVGIGDLRAIICLHIGLYVIFGDALGLLLIIFIAFFSSIVVSLFSLNKKIKNKRAFMPYILYAYMVYIILHKYIINYLGGTYNLG